jgi:hypothetical protein
LTPPRRKAPKIKALFFDVDGVLTDGRISIDEEGRESKVFDTKDGHGIKMAIASGLHVAWISGRTSKATEQRALELGVAQCRQGVADKAKVYLELCRFWGVVLRRRPWGTTNLTLLTVSVSACPCVRPAAAKTAQVVLRERRRRSAKSASSSAHPPVQQAHQPARPVRLGALPSRQS